MTTRKGEISDAVPYPEIMPESPAFPTEETVRELFVQHYRAIVLFFSRRGFQQDEAQDLAQETFVRMFRAIGSLNDESSARSWLFAIASNVWRNEVRRRHASNHLALNDARDVRSVDDDIATGTDAPNALSKAIDREQRDRLASAIRSLPPQMRRAISLRIIGDLRYREIAAVMQVSIDAVKSHLAQARTRLKEELQDAADDLDEEPWRTGSSSRHKR